MAEKVRADGKLAPIYALYPAELRSLMYEKRRSDVFQSCKVVDFQQWSIRGLITADHRDFASTNNAVSNKNEPKTCRIAVVGELRQSGID